MIDLQHRFQEVEMIAENLGSIPPNTALLIVTAGRTPLPVVFIFYRSEKCKGPVCI